MDGQLGRPCDLGGYATVACPHRVRGGVTTVWAPKSKKPSAISQRWASFGNTPGSDLLSHAVSHTVPSTVAGLTSVFGMGTGVALLL